MTSSHGFAQKHMKRYGWSEGKGLGRMEDGMKNAIKVKRKNNKDGLGHDQGAEFTFHWWDHIFNKAANSFKVCESDEGALIEKCEGKKIRPLLISTKRRISSKFSNKSLLYGTFVKSGTYDSNSIKTSGSLTDDDSSDESSDDDDNDNDGKALLNNDTLEKMFKKTGLTGHKAARHGFALNGKLQRLLNQENKQSKEYTKLKESDDNEDNTICNDEKTKKKKEYTKLKESDDNEDNTICNDEKTKKKKKQKKKGGLHIKHKLEDTISLLDDQPKKKKKKKK